MNQRAVFILSLSCWLFFGCSTEKLLDQGKYEQAINRALVQLERNPANVRNLHVIEESLTQANQKNLALIKKLKASENPNWEQIYYQYKEITSRQAMVNNIDNLQFGYATIDYSEELKEAQLQTAEGLYQEALKDLDQNHLKKDYQNAYYNLSKLNRIYPGYKDVYALKADAKKQGMVNILFVVTNPKNLAISEGIYNALMPKNIAALNGDWTKYHTDYRPGEYYDYTVEVEIGYFAVGSNQTKTNSYSDEKETIVRHEIKKDEKGNPVRDQNGNVVKVPIKKTIKAKVTKTRRSREASINATFRLIDNYEKDTFHSIPISFKYIFESESATVVGNKEALSKSSLTLSKTKLKPFPTYHSMLQNASKGLTGKVKNEIAKNRNRFIP